MSRPGMGQARKGVSEPLAALERAAIRDAVAMLLDGDSLADAAELWRCRRIVLDSGGAVTPQRVREVLRQPRLAENIVPQDDWERVQEALRAARGRPRENRALLSGILTCEVCGGTLHGRWHTRAQGGARRLIYHCGVAGCPSIDGPATEDRVALQVMSALGPQAGLWPRATRHTRHALIRRCFARITVARANSPSQPPGQRLTFVEKPRALGPRGGKG